VKQNEQQKSKIRYQKGKNVVNSQQSPQMLKTLSFTTFATFISSLLFTNVEAMVQKMKTKVVQL
jgi:hypothetical protein